LFECGIVRQFTELLRERLVGGIGQAASKLTEATAALEEIKQHDRLPFSTDHL
jgi:hypothetical protein